MKKINCLILIICLLSFSTILSACDLFSNKKNTITFMNGEQNYSTLQTNGYETISFPSNPSKIGYNFKGWYFDYGVWSDKLTRNYYKDKLLDENVTVYAYYKAISYNISYILDGGINNTSNPTTYTIETENITFQNPTKDGYDFAGWFTSSTFSDSSAISQLPKGSYGNKTLYAKWEQTSNITKISNKSELLAWCANPVTDAKLMANINLNNMEWTPIKNFTVSDYANIFNNGTIKDEYCFSNTFDGNNFVISNFKITKTDYMSLGFFGCVKNSTIKNLGLTDFTIDISPTSVCAVGAFACLIESSTISNCYVTGEINSENYNENNICTGFFVEAGYSTFENCYTDCDIFIDNKVENSNVYGGDIIASGFCGTIESCTCNKCYTLGNITSSANSSNSAGFAIGISSSNINQCFAKGDVNGSFASGLIGYVTDSYSVSSSSTITNCYSEGNITGINTSGLIDTISSSYANMTVNIENCYTSGNIVANGSGNIFSAGIIGTISDNLTILVSNCYSCGDISATSTNGSAFSGNIVAKIENNENITIKDCYHIVTQSVLAEQNGDNGTTLIKGTNTSKTNLLNYIKNNWDSEIWKFHTDNNPTLLYATNSQGQYVITFINGSTTHATISTNGNVKIVLPEEPIKNGYIFMGWYLDNNIWQNKLTEDTYLNTPLTSNVNVYARWDLQVYLIHYILYDGTNNIENPTSYTINSQITLKNPTKVGYKFQGWYTNLNFLGNAVNQIELGSYGDKTFYAKWKSEENKPEGLEAEFTDFNYANIEGIGDAYYKEVSANLVLFNFSSYIEVGDGCTWALCKDLDGNQQVASKTVSLVNGYNIYYILVMSGNDTKLYCVVIYKLCYCTVSFNTLGGYPLPVDQIVPENQYAVRPSQNPYKDGYTFTDWDFDFSEKLNLSATYERTNVTDNAVTMTASKRIIAQYIANTYSIEYILNGGTDSTNNPTTYTIEGDTVLLAPEKNMYEFLGWYDNPEFEGDAILVAGDGMYGNKTLYAKWESILIISGTTLTGITPFGKANCHYMTIPDNITTIEESALCDCIGLTSIIIPTTVTSIGNSAFNGCSNLQEMTLPFVGGSIKSASDTYQYPFGYIFGTSSYAGGVATTQYFYGSKITSRTDSTYYIPSSLKSVTITGGNILYGAFYNCSKLTSITIPNGVTSIGDYAFCYCSSLISITIPDSVTSIEKYAFEYCSSLTSITIPDSVTSIGYSVFRGCSNLQEMTLPFLGSSTSSYSSLSYFFGGNSYDSNSFYLPSYLKTVTIMSGTSIMEHAFYNCSSLTSITIPSSVTSIGDSAFYGCSGLISITIPSRLTSIGDSAFYNCSSLTSIAIPSSVTSIGDNAFLFCDSLTKVNITDLSAWCNITFEDTYANPLSYAKHLYLNDTEITNLTIPNGVTSIGDYAFDGCSSLTSITIPDSITSIGKYAFGLCTATINWDGTPTITTMGKYAFCLYKGDSITIPSSVTSIGEDAFSSCSGLTSITIPTTVTSIGNYAFEYCSSLTSITIPDSVASIGDSAFRGCTNLQSITLPFVGGSIKTASDTCQYPFGYIFGTSSYTGGVATKQYFYGSSKYSITDSTYYIPSSLKSVTITGGNILYGAFYNCSSLTSITIPDSVTSIGNYAFYNCSSLTSITIPSSVTSIGGYAFNLCTATIDWSGTPTITTIGGAAFSGYKGNSITIPESVTSIGDSAFKGCSSLISITIPDSVTSIGYSAFEYCSSLTSITIPDSVTSIGWGAFEDCSSLISITIPISVTSIGGYVFSGCSSLISITIPSSVTSIGSYAFQNCTAEILWSGTPTIQTIGNYAFYEYKGNSITIPNSVTSIGYASFSGCCNLQSMTLPFVGDSIKTTSDTYQYPFGYIFGTSSYTGGVATEQYFYGSSTTSRIYKTYYIPSSLKSVTIIGGNILYGAFYNCSGLTSITILNNVTSIEEFAFYNCSDLTSITIPSGVTSIGYCAFKGCSSLTSITIPSSVTLIGGCAFYNCSNLQSMTLPFVGRTTSSNTYFGYIFGASSYNNNYYYVPSSLKAVTITGGTSIGEYAFYNCSKLISITIPSSVTSIGSSAFCYCSSLTSITILSSVTSIGDCAFKDCNSLTSITIPSSVTSIGKFAFYNCTAEILWSGTPTIQIIGNYAFCGYKGDSITIPSSVTSIGEYAFENYTMEILWSGTPTIQTIGNFAFYGYKGDSITIPSSVTSIGEYAFSDCSGLTSITIPDSITSIKGYAFQNCTAEILWSGTPTIQTIGIAFCGYKGDSITIPDSVTSIGWGAFEYCSSLTSITIPSSVTSIEKYAFRGCNNLTNIVFESPNGWYRTSNNNKTDGTLTDLSNSSTNATYFKSTYWDYYWYKK